MDGLEVKERRIGCVFTKSEEWSCLSVFTGNFFVGVNRLVPRPMLSEAKVLVCGNHYHGQSTLVYLFTVSIHALE